MISPSANTGSSSGSSSKLHESFLPTGRKKVDSRNAPLTETFALVREAEKRRSAPSPIHRRKGTAIFARGNCRCSSPPKLLSSGGGGRAPVFFGALAMGAGLYYRN